MAKWTAFLLVGLLPTLVLCVRYWGTSEAGGEFGSVIPGTYGIDYIYPNPSSIDFFASQGMNVIRLPFLWERIQRSLFAELDSGELIRLASNVTYITQVRNMSVFLDVHNYARYYGQYIGSPQVPYNAFTDLWTRLAKRFGNNRKVIFALMNEPHDLPTEDWLTAANLAISAIRQTGATNLITVPGTAYTGAHSWYQNVDGFSANSDVMGGIRDPFNHFVIEVHEYLDSDYSGTHPTCAGPTFGSDGLKAFTGWARERNFKAWLGEFAGAPSDPVCISALKDMLSYVSDNEDVYEGWTFWSAGPWWGDYMFNLEPGSPTNPSLMATLRPFIGVTSGEPISP